MSLKKTRFRKGVIVAPDTDALEGIEGEIKVDSADKKIKTTLDSASREIVTNSQAQTLTNKTLTSPVLNGDLTGTAIDTDTSLSANSDTKVASQKAVKAYIDAGLASQNDASEIVVVPAGTIASTNVQDALEELDGDIQAHLSDTVDAHDASTISIVDAGGNFTSTEVEGALAESMDAAQAAQADATQAIADAAAAQSDIDNHIADISDAHDASAISNIPAGNLAATDVQGALNELQTDVDARQPTITGAATTITSSDLTASRAVVSDGSGKIAASSTTSTEIGYVSGVTSAIQTQLNAKVSSSGGTLTNGSVVTPTRLDVKQDTKANLLTYAASATNGQLVFATDEKKMYQVVDNALVSVGGGSASLETIFQLLAEEEITDWATGDNATFLGGGTLSGTFVKNTTNPLQGDADYKYTQAAGSLNDYLASPAQDVDPRFRGKEVTLFFPYTYDGANDDIEVIFYDVTNAAIIPSSAYIQAAASVTMFKTNIVIPSTCASIRVGFQVKVLNSTKIFVFDSVQLSSDTTIYADIANISDWEAYTPTLTGFGTATSVEFEWRRVGDSIEIRGKWTSGTSTATEARISLPNSYTSANTIKIPSLKIAGWGGRTSTSSTYFGSISTLIEPSVQYLTLGHGTSSNSPLGKRNGSDLMSSGQSASIFATIPVAGLISSNSNILTAPETFSTDTAPLTYAGSGSYTLSTLANAPVGTYITFTYAINTNTRTQTTTAPTQTTSDMNTNGILLYSRPYNAASTAAQPTAIAIQIGKGLKGVSLNLYKSTGKTTSGTIDSLELSTGTIAYGLDYKDYNESTGILILDAGVNSTAVTNKTFRYSDVTTQTSGYLVINASKNPALTGLNINAVGARYTSTSGQAIGNSATLITYETKVADTHGAYNSGVYTVPETGWYQINASYQTGTSVTISTTASTFIWMYIDGANYKTSFVRGNGASTTYGVHISESVYLRKNQTVSIYGSSSVATTASTGISANAFSIVKTSTGTGN